MVQEVTIDLRRAPHQRWVLTPAQGEQARELLRQYKTELGLRPDLGELLISLGRKHIRDEYWAEMESLAVTLALPVSEVALCNFYYDATKVVLGRALGCTAFAIDGAEGVLHARNLDWWTENFALGRMTTLCHFVGGAAGRFTTVGWPGFVGAFSGIAPGRVAVTLNAVLSSEPTQAATPVELLLRTVLEEARSFEEARAVLSESPIPCDCLLLLTGVGPGEIAVIERTPSRFGIRDAQSGYVCVTNGYQRLDAGLGGGPSELLGSWCQRFERVNALMRERRPESAEDCFGYLSDAAVRMNMTVQQMVFRAATGEYWVRIPGPAEGG